jgi:hypothetical protein
VRVLQGCFLGYGTETQRSWLLLLLTGAEDGSISVWNFRSGRLLSAVSQPPAEGSSQWGSGSGVEVTGLAVATTTDTNGQTAPCIVATGWDRKVSVCLSTHAECVCRLSSSACVGVVLDCQRAEKSVLTMGQFHQCLAVVIQGN